LERVRRRTCVVDLLPVDLIRGPRGVGVLSDLWTGAMPRPGDLPLSLAGWG